MGKPAASDVTLAPGAGHGDEGDASFQGPAQEEDQAQIEALPAQPKPTNPEAAMSAQAQGSVIELAARTATRTTKLKAAEVTAVPRAGDGQVTVRPKPEKRKNAKERAKERARAKGKLGATDDAAAVTPEVTSPALAGLGSTNLATAHPKPEKRKNARERAKEKYAAKDRALDRTTPDTTAKAKSKVEKTTKSKAKASKVAGKAA